MCLYCEKCNIKCKKVGYGTALMLLPAIYYKCQKCNNEYWEISNNIMTKSHWKRIKHMNKMRGKGNHVYE